MAWSSPEKHSAPRRVAAADLRRPPLLFLFFFFLLDHWREWSRSPTADCDDGLLLFGSESPEPVRVELVVVLFVAGCPGGFFFPLFFFDFFFVDENEVVSVGDRRFPFPPDPVKIGWGDPLDFDAVGPPFPSLAGTGRWERSL